MNKHVNKNARANVRVLKPQAGPQEKFCSSSADIVIYGGAAGGGKSYALELEASRNIQVPGYSAIMFRRTSPELTGGGSLWEKSQDIYPHIGGIPREHPNLDWTFRTSDPRKDAIIEFSHLQHEKDVNAHQGKEYAFIGIDELTHFTSRQFWMLVSRNRSTCGVKPYMRCTCNPDPDSFVLELIQWWIGEDGYPIPERDGVIRWVARDEDDALHFADSEDELKEMLPGQEVIAKSITFIASKLENNPALTKADPSYKGSLMLLPKVDRERLLGGNWKVRATRGKYFKMSMFNFVDEPPPQNEVVMRGRAWDLAASEPTDSYPDPDWTIGIKGCKTKDKRIFIEHMEFLRKNPGDVEKAVTNTAAADGRRVAIYFWQDPGGAGKHEQFTLRRLLMGYVVKSVPANEDKLTYAKPVASSAEGGLITIVRGEWNKKFFSQLESFPPLNERGNPIPGVHDDVVDALSLLYLMFTRSAADRLKAMGRR